MSRRDITTSVYANAFIHILLFLGCYHSLSQAAQSSSESSSVSSSGFPQRQKPSLSSLSTTPKLEIRQLPPVHDGNVEKVLKLLEFHHISNDGEEEHHYNNHNKFTYDAKPLSHIILPATCAIVTTMYGTALLLVAPHQAQGQLHMLNMFRVFGQKKLEQALQTWQDNFRMAKFAFLRRAPHFLVAGKSLLDIQQRIRNHRHNLQVTHQAKADGVLTRQEAKRISKLHKREIRILKRDFRRLMRASTSVRVILRALDVDDLWDIVRSFAVQCFAVLATNHHHHHHHHNNKKDTTTTTTEVLVASSGISNWCLFLNLASLLSDITCRRMGPWITHTIEMIRSKMRRSHQEQPQPQYQPLHPKLIQTTGRIVMFGTAAGLVLGQRHFAQRLNMALVSSAILMRGLVNFVNIILSWDNDDNDGIWPFVGRILECASGGVLMITMTGIRLFVMHQIEEDKFTPPVWLQRPIQVVEQGLHHLAVVVTPDRIV